AGRGAGAVSVRAVADRAGTTTRAVYALFGSKEGLLQALAQHTFELLMETVDAVPRKRDPRDDLIARAVHGFRAFALAHPALFRLFFNAQVPRSRLGSGGRSSQVASRAQLLALVEPLEAAGQLGGHSAGEAALLVDIVCSGLAMREICGGLEARHAERVWKDSLSALLTGLSASPRATV
ncbi:MAG TPA: TetR/AcrR family transcriptional regulator, partial [Candidatus Dormibacteraeota bacterium]|nr:TetR/AcrR family transcriptional regulator [Candidatus Dormibacteraeota bacterium]